MQLANYRDAQGNIRAALLEPETAIPLADKNGAPRSLFELFESADPAEQIIASRDERQRFSRSELQLVAPVDHQEIWAAGVTYTRSRTARMEESEGAAQFYDAVYDAPRPELFFKSPPYRVVGPSDPIRIRRDSTWNVPEPELTLVLNSRAEIVGYTIGNDMSSRDIEGENPLYLPQAKIYDGACSIGPVITLAAAMPPLDQVEIRLEIRRAGAPAFAASISASQLHRRPHELVDWLTRELKIPHGAMLMTGTGIVPDDDFSLQSGDEVEISIDGIGALENTVA